MKEIDIIVGYCEKVNSTIRLLKSLENIYTNHLILVDNATSKEENDKLDNYLKDKWKDITKIRLETLIGIPATYNKALEKIKYKYAFFIHNDMELFDSEWQNKMFDFINNNERVGLLALAGRQTILNWGVADEGTTKHNMRHLIQAKIHYPMKAPFEKVAVIDGCGFIMNTEMNLKFDERYLVHHYYDLDISMQVYERGFECWACNVECEHWGDIEGSTRHVKQYKDAINNDSGLLINNRQKFVEKWKGKLPFSVK